MSKKIKGGSSAPVCWWCGERIPLNNEWRAHIPEMALPTPSGVHVCGPSCPQQPKDALIYSQDSLRGLI